MFGAVFTPLCLFLYTLRGSFDTHLFLKYCTKLILVEELDIDMIDSINPFQVMLEMQKQFSPGDPRLAEHLPPTPDSGEFVKSQGNPCDVCGEFTSILIFAKNGFRESDIEDYARKMYPLYSQSDTPTWIVADPDEDNHDQNTPILTMQVRPERKSINHINHT